ncbi:uncharacterized protein LOC106353509 [Brassica napus]|uniref:uncharacterized protein LOC106353509 n=1 Tax=Brassica napus TaxID=3708 RepID=UPI00207AD387|nr:uncharacterized protein LOC106353509 [Brassica napus]
MAPPPWNPEASLVSPRGSPSCALPIRQWLKGNAKARLGDYRASLRGLGFDYCWLLSYKQEVRQCGALWLFPSGANSLGEALILFFLSKQFIDSLGMTILRCTFMLFCSLIAKSLKPYQRVKIETLRCRKYMGNIWTIRMWHCIRSGSSFGL